MSKQQRNSLCNCGSGKKYKKCCMLKDEQSQISLMQQQVQDTFITDVFALIQQQKLNEALALSNNRIATYSDRADGYYALANIHFMVGQNNQEYWDKAIESANALIRLYKEHKCNDSQLDHYLANVYNILLTIYSFRNDSDNASIIYQQAIALDESKLLPAVYLEMLSKANDERADSVMKRALKFHPNDPYLLSCCAKLHARRNEHHQAITIATRLINQGQYIEEMLLVLFYNYYAMGNYSEMMKVIDLFITKYNQNKAIADTMRINKALFLPQVVGLKGEIEERIQQLDQNIDMLLRENMNLDMRYIVLTHFPMAYYNINCKELAIKVANFFRSKVPQLNYVAPHCREYQVPSGKRKVGIISGYLNNKEHPVTYSYMSLIKGVIEQDDVEVFLFSRSSYEQSCFAGMPKIKPNFVQISNDIDSINALQAVQEKIASYKLDILIYTDIGMRAESYFLAFARFAPVQCLYAGHPMTTGLAAMDYFFVTQFHDVKQEHYTEMLKVFDNPLTYIHKTIPKNNTFDKSSIGIKEDMISYCCPMDVVKIHPDYDEVVERILDENERNVFILFYRDNQMQYNMFHQRLKERIGTKIDRVIFMRWADKETFVSIVSAVDAVLDSFPFGGGSTSAILFSAGIPIVTYPSEYLSGRATFGQYHTMGIDVLIARNVDEYIEKSLKLANDKQFYQQTKEQILENNHTLFENENAIIQLNDFLKTCVLEDQTKLLLNIV